MQALIQDLNEKPGHLLPGVRIVPYYNRTRLVNTTTQTVQENLFHGIALVSVVLLMFLGNVRTAVIVAVNVPLAVLIAFAALFLRKESGQSAVHRRGGYWHSGRFLRDHGRKHLPPPDT